MCQQTFDVNYRVVGQNGRSCHRRTCDQTITGRSFRAYSRVLQIVQNEDYLSAADKSIIRKKRQLTEKETSIPDWVRSLIIFKC